MRAADPQAVLCPPLETTVFLVLTVDAGAVDRFRDLLTKMVEPATIVAERRAQPNRSSATSPRAGASWLRPAGAASSSARQVRRCPGLPNAAQTRSR